MTKGTISDLRTAASHLRRCVWEDPEIQDEIDALVHRIERLEAEETARCLRQLAEC